MGLRKPTKFLIFTRRGIDIEQYPAILKYLEQFKERLMPQPKDYTGKEWPGRKAGTYKWYEIQDAVDYHGEFERGKIVYAEIAIQGQFILDHRNYSAYMLNSESLGLLGILNSRLFTFIFSNVSSTIRGGFLRWKKQYMQEISVPTQEQIESSGIEVLVQQILAKKKSDASADVSALEEEIDRIVYGLYGLEEGEILTIVG